MVLGSVLVGLKVAGIPGAVFGIPIAAVISALFLHALSGRRGAAPVAERAAARVGRREGRLIRRPREPDPTVDRDVEPHAHRVTPRKARRDVDGAGERLTLSCVGGGPPGSRARRSGRGRR